MLNSVRKEHRLLTTAPLRTPPFCSNRVPIDVTSVYMSRDITEPRDQYGGISEKDVGKRIMIKHRTDVFNEHIAGLMSTHRIQ